jgi:hypothetical protein
MLFVGIGYASNCNDLHVSSFAVLAALHGSANGVTGSAICSEGYRYLGTGTGALQWLSTYFDMVRCSVRDSGGLDAG